MSVFLRRMTNHRVAFLNLLLLFAGKTAGLLVGILFLPMYHRLLGTAEFGVVAVILSLQALLTMMDLGMSTMLGRDAAISGDLTGTHKLLMAAEGSLSIFYLVIGAAAFLAAVAGLFGSIGIVTVVTVIVLLWALVLQNLYFSVLLAKRSYAVASTTQIVGSLIRAFSSAYVLSYISSTLEAFLLTQALCAIGHAALSKYFCQKLLKTSSGVQNNRPNLRDCFALARQGTSLIFFSAAGAAVTQLDKPLVSGLVSAADLAPYFLATTLCMVPISVLAGPVSQYYQPRVFAAISHVATNKNLDAIRQYTSTILLATCLPALILWQGRNFFTLVWLGRGSITETTSSYVAILLPGFAVGALGFVPYALLVAAKDYRFQAFSSIVLTVVTLAAATFGAWHGSVVMVCWIYAIYHTSSTMVSWIRATRLPVVQAEAKYSLSIAAKVVVVTAACGGILNQFIK